MSGLDVLTLFTGAIGLITLGRGILKIPSHLHEEWKSPKEMQIRKSYGILATYGTKILLNDAWVLLHRIETDILPSDDQAILALKSAYSSDCAMTAVAGAITAQVAITALSLPLTLRVHWIVQASYVVSLVSGCLSVYTACIAQRILGNLVQLEDFKDWLSRSRLETISDEFVDATYERSLYQPEIVEVIVRDNPGLTHSIPTQWDKNRHQGSLYAAMLITAPAAMLNYSLGTLVTGLGGYFGWTWTWGLHGVESNGGDRNVFIIFIVFTMLYMFLYAAPRQMKERESVGIRQKRRLANEIEKRSHGSSVPDRKEDAVVKKFEMSPKLSQQGAGIVDNGTEV